MEENNNEQKSVEQEVIKENNSSTNSTQTTNKVVEFIKAKKKIIGIIILAIIVIIVAIDLIFVSPKEVVKKFINAMDSGKMDKAIDYMDIAGAQTFSELDEESYDDFWGDYKDLKDSDEYKDAMDELDEYLEDNEYIDEFRDIIEDYDVSIKIDKFNRVKKLASHLYRVSARIEVTSDEGDYDGTVYFYVMKNGTKSYIVGTESDDSDMSYLFSIY